MENFQFYSSISDLDLKDRELIQNAQKASGSSYSPYSNYMVGAAVRLQDDQIIVGSNQENASYPAGLCAERVALFHITATYPDKEIESIATVARRAYETDFRPVSPCGICRQVMLEFELRQKAPIRVIMQASDGRWVVTKNAEVMLPFSFAQDNL
ncbi:MAG: cytidine deaminase [Bacteroidota bacterium]